MENTNRYEYMLNMPHKQSMRHKHMSLEDRAAQFGAFRALTGHEEAISETGRLTEERIELDEYQKAELDLKLRYVMGNLEQNQEIMVVYFSPDMRKQGGAYVTKKGAVKAVREFERLMIFADGDAVALDEIVHIECTMPA